MLEKLIVSSCDLRASYTTRVRGGTTEMALLSFVRCGVQPIAIRCENVPEGIRKEDHDAGLKSSLDNLAAFTELA
jgi:hypothetical protein